MDATEILDKYVEENNLYSFEGDSGLARLNKLCCAMGYNESGFKYGTSLESFLSDNPGACNAIFEWIQETIEGVPEWSELLSDQLTEEDSEDDDIDEDIDSFDDEDE